MYCIIKYPCFFWFFIFIIFFVSQCAFQANCLEFVAENEGILTRNVETFIGTPPRKVADQYL